MLQLHWQINLPVCLPVAAGSQEPVQYIVEKYNNTIFSTVIVCFICLVSSSFLHGKMWTIYLLTKGLICETTEKTVFSVNWLSLRLSSSNIRILDCF